MTKIKTHVASLNQWRTQKIILLNNISNSSLYLITQLFKSNDEAIIGDIIIQKNFFFNFGTEG